MRFTTRTPTLRELVWCQKVARGDMEAVLLLLESRRMEGAWDVGSLSGEDLAEAIKEMSASFAESVEIDNVLAELKT